VPAHPADTLDTREGVVCLEVGSFRASAGTSLTGPSVGTIRVLVVPLGMVHYLGILM
jgi:hypothetical protein